MGRAARRALGWRRRPAPVRLLRAARRGGLGAVRQRRRGADPHAHRDVDAAGPALQPGGDPGLRHGGGLHRRQRQPAAGGLEPGEHRLGRLLRARLRRVRRGHAAGKPGERRDLPAGAVPLFPPRPAAGLCAGAIEAAAGGDPRPRDLRRRWLDAAGPARRAVRPGAAGRPRQRGGRGLCGTAAGGGRARAGDLDPAGAARSALADRGLLAGHVPGGLRPEERRSHRPPGAAPEPPGRARRYGRPRWVPDCFPPPSRR